MSETGSLPMPGVPRSSFSWSFRWSAREHARALRQLGRYRPRRRLWSTLLWMLYALAALFLVVAYEVGMWMALVALWVTFMRALTPWATAWQVRRTDPAVHADLVQTVDDEGFSVHYGGADLRLPWSSIPRVVETREFFLFFYSPVLAYYAPKRVVPAEWLEDLRETVWLFKGDAAELLPMSAT